MHTKDMPLKYVILLSLSINYFAWGVQLAIWNIIIVIEKLFTFVSELTLKKQLEGISYFFLGWLQKYPNL